MNADPLDRFRLDGRVAILTGASAGLGARFAHVLDQAGARVVMCARRSALLEQVAASMRDVVCVQCDLHDPSAPDLLVDTALERYGRIDIVVNNSAVEHIEPAVEQSVDDFTAELRLNLVAPFELSRKAARWMIESGSGGSIVNVASIWGMVGIGQIPDAGYAASKTGLVGMTRELAAQWARHGVRVNALAPGWFPSEKTQERMFEDERATQWIRRHTPLGRAGEIHEFDGALLFLASDASSYVTGIVLPVDGGWTAI